MADFTGEFDGFRYHADWMRASAGRASWSATVRNAAGEMCGAPGGMLHNAGRMTDAECDQAVRLAVEDAIGKGLSVDRSSGN